jgi:hypothetical protein
VALGKSHHGNGDVYDRAGVGELLACEYFEALMDELCSPGESQLSLTHREEGIGRCVHYWIVLGFV